MMQGEIEGVVGRAFEKMVNEWFQRLTRQYGLSTNQAHRVMQNALDVEIHEARDRCPEP